MNDDERGFLGAVWDGPGDDTARLVYADWLEEHDRAAHADAVRHGVARPERLTLAEGARVTISFTSERPESRGAAVSVTLHPGIEGVAFTVYKGLIERALLTWERWLELASAGALPSPEVWLTTLPVLETHGMTRVDDEAWLHLSVPGRPIRMVRLWDHPGPLCNPQYDFLRDEFPQVRRWNFPVLIENRSAEVGTRVSFAEGSKGVLASPVDGNGYALVEFDRR